VTPKERVRQAFKPYDDVVMGDPGGHGPDEKAVLDLVRAAIAEEREACARIAGARAAGLALLCPDTDETQSRIAEAQVIERDIRARG
jgi:hypothetical protein